MLSYGPRQETTGQMPKRFGRSILFIRESKDDEQDPGRDVGLMLLGRHVAVQKVWL